MTHPFRPSHFAAQLAVQSAPWRPRAAAWLRRSVREALTMVLLAGCGSLVLAASLTLDGAHGPRQLDGAALARHPKAQDIQVPGDVAYQRPMLYRAVPLAVVLNELGLGPSDTLEAVATDGFIAQLPGALVLAQEPGQPQPWLAIEIDSAPWPALPGKAASAGPFYIVWPHSVGVRSEQRRLSLGFAGRTYAEFFRWSARQQRWCSSQSRPPPFSAARIQAPTRGA